MTIKKAAILVSFLVLLTSTQIQARATASLDNFDRSAGMDRPEITLAQNSLEFNEKIRRLEQERDEKRREFDEEVKASRALASKPGARIGMTAKQVREKLAGVNLKKLILLRQNDKLQNSGFTTVDSIYILGMADCTQYKTDFKFKLEKY